MRFRFALPSEEPGGAVAFGFVVVVGPAEWLEVLNAGGPVVGDGVDVVPLEPVFAVAAEFGAGDAVEVGWFARVRARC